MLSLQIVKIFLVIEMLVTDDASRPVLVALNFTTLARNGPLPTDHIPKGQVC